MSIISPEHIVIIFDDENKSTSTIVCKVPVGEDKKGNILYRTEKHTVSRSQADKLSVVLLKTEKDAANLRDGLKPGPSKKLIV